MTPFQTRPTPSLPRRRAGALLLAGALAAGPALVVVPGAAAAATGTSWLRLAHLSPDTPEVDVYLAPFSGGDKPVVLRGVGYGDVSAYQAVPAGTYTATMRWAGDAGTSTPVLSATATVSPGKAYTVAAVGLKADLTTKVLRDDLAAPAPGKGRVRLIQAATRADSVDVRAEGGPLLAQDTAFGTATGYATVPAGRWTLRVTPSGGTAKPLTATVDVPAGRVASVLVLDGAGDATLKVAAVVDSEGSAAMPKGGVNTGHGPGATAASPSAMTWGAAPLALGGLLAGAGLVMLRRRRPSAR
ncbi:DUF4397 domain-containing protein [Motilibacter aurantiacus]|uniref:DUF4397 domain-containing protein n=1 Tax=Motilibacter aurantiacus TaxID=2714955 RepID=UPI00140A6D4A|nr:DUF4397 domain-containing protein [Motilibacter aurantiacus]